MPDQSIPVLTLSDFEPGSATEARFVDAVGKSLEDTGFFCIRDHGVDTELIRRSYALVEQFFTLPEETKRRYEDLKLKGQRGFTSFGREHAKDHPTPDLKEFWHVGRDEFCPNLWPEEVPGFRQALGTLYDQLDQCALRLLEAVSLYVGEPRERVSEIARGGNTILRIIHYPPVPAEADTSSMRAAPHEDINLITLLCEATAGGLELLRRDGTWLPIQARPGEIVVDAGDMLQNLTNGLLKSTTHRVVNPGNSRERRFSMPFFVHPRSEVSLSPLPGCVARTGGEKRFPDITAGGYLEQRLREIGLG